MASNSARYLRNRPGDEMRKNGKDMAGNAALRHCMEIDLDPLLLVSDYGAGRIPIIYTKERKA